MSTSQSTQDTSGPPRFSPDVYRRLLADLVASRRVVTFAERPRDGLLLRFDVDYDLGWAASLAAINAERGVRATFFVQVGAEMYNSASAPGREALDRLAAAGQRIGLHYHHRGGELDVARLKVEFALLRLMAPQAEPVVAWHNPEGKLDDINAAAEAAGFVTAYADTYFGPGRYISDSNLRNDAAAIAAFVATSDAPLVQVLLHPLFWIIGGDQPGQVLLRTLRHRVERLMAGFDDNRVWSGGLGEQVMAELAAADWWKAGRKP